MAFESKRSNRLARTSEWNMTSSSPGASHSLPGSVQLLLNRVDGSTTRRKRYLACNKRPRRVVNGAATRTRQRSDLGRVDAGGQRRRRDCLSSSVRGAGTASAASSAARLYAFRVRKLRCRRCRTGDALGHPSEATDLE